MSRCRSLRNASRLQLAAVAFLFLLSTSLSFSPSTSSSGPHQHGRVFLLIILDPSERTKSPCTSIHDARQQQHQQQGIFEAFFSFISRGVFSAVDVNNDGRIEDTEVEVAILKVRGSVACGKRAVRSSAGGGRGRCFGHSPTSTARSLSSSKMHGKKKNATHYRCTTWSTSASPGGRTPRREN
jgi:hypothetical protein